MGEDILCCGSTENGFYTDEVNFIQVVLHHVPGVGSNYRATKAHCLHRIMAGLSLAVFTVTN